MRRNCKYRFFFFSEKKKKKIIIIIKKIKKFRENWREWKYAISLRLLSITDDFCDTNEFRYLNEKRPFSILRDEDKIYTLVHEYLR